MEEVDVPECPSARGAAGLSSEGLGGLSCSQLVKGFSKSSHPRSRTSSLPETMMKKMFELAAWIFKNISFYQLYETIHFYSSLIRLYGVPSHGGAQRFDWNRSFVGLSESPVFKLLSAAFTSWFLAVVPQREDLSPRCIIKGDRLHVIIHRQMSARGQTTHTRVWGVLTFK